LCDNATAVAYLNNFGGTKSMKCNSKARDNSTPHPVKDASVVIVTVGGSLWTGAERCKCFFHQLISSKHSYSINFLELQAIYLGILCFLRYLCHKHIKILCDNATAVAYLNNFGGTKIKFFHCKVKASIAQASGSAFQLTNLLIL
jgi:hypothetical protein